ncbi:expressed unknown protein [Seminavis robusta]|uniref:Uncharacterized protein n=1 Tax=Seminavis robusta TaxID=568900 RepID=A0A9N8H770_9STRA|nr:expressed unknown protein [Seminavis robusta]|eukprot:Sro168_g074911.1  (195) ;mRNA; r:88987-89571
MATMERANTSRRKNRTTMMLDDSLVSVESWSDYELDDSNVTLQMSNRRPLGRSPSETDLPSSRRIDRANRMQEASRWESFPSLRRGMLSAPPRRAMSPSPPLEGKKDATRNDDKCGAPRVPQRTSSDMDTPATKTRKQVSFSPSSHGGEMLAAPGMRPDSDALTKAKFSYRSRSNTSSHQHSLKLPTRQPSFQT